MRLQLFLTSEVFTLGTDVFIMLGSLHLIQGTHTFALSMLCVISLTIRATREDRASGKKKNVPKRKCQWRETRTHSLQDSSTFSCLTQSRQTEESPIRNPPSCPKECHASWSFTHHPQLVSWSASARSALFFPTTDEHDPAPTPLHSTPPHRRRLEGFFN